MSVRLSRPVRYRVLHDTEYAYSQPVTLSQQRLHLPPRETAWQKVLAHGLEIDPAPTRRSASLDAFGNQVVRFDLEQPHDRLLVRAESRVEVWPRPPRYPAASQPWDALVDDLRYRAGRAYRGRLLEAVRFRFESTHVRVKSDFVDYARHSFAPGRPVLEGAIDLMERIHADFTFDPAATTVATPVTEVLARRRGVCQDFAHLMLSCLRSLGLPARYVSGYLLTQPPAGQPRLVGADASHAWVAVFVPALGWVDLDPTNDCMVDTEHITVAWGADFADVTPQRGVILGGGAHEVTVRVTVTPEEDGAAD